MFEKKMVLINPRVENNYACARAHTHARLFSRIYKFLNDKRDAFSRSSSSNNGN